MGRGTQGRYIKKRDRVLEADCGVGLWAEFFMIMGLAGKQYAGDPPKTENQNWTATCRTCDDQIGPKPV